MKNCTSNCEASQDSGALSNPLSFLRSGYFTWDYAGLPYRGDVGYYWSPRSASTTYSGHLSFTNAYLSPQVGSYRGYGFAVRSL